MTFYRKRLLDAVRGLVGDGDLNLRLTHAAVHLIQIDDDDVPADMLAAFERVRDPLIQAAAQAVVDLLAAETGGP